MRTTQELIERLRERALDYALAREHRPLKPTGMLLDQAAARLSEQAAELEALRGKLAGVDEKALEVAAKALDEYCRRGVWGSGASVQSEQEARAAIAAYLAALGGAG